MSSLTLWLIRHGETEVNSGNWSDKPNETGLTSKGMQQAEHIIQEIPKKPDLLIVSPLLRAQQTAQFIMNKWRDIPQEIQPIQEFIYLSPKRLKAFSVEERKQAILEYWEKKDPDYCDGEECESFSDFLKRVECFSEEIKKKQGFIIIIGHGQFFKAYQMGLEKGFKASSDWMASFRRREKENPIHNGEIIKICFS